MQRCPSDDSIAALLSAGAAPSEDREAIAAHVDQCPTCFALIADLGRATERGDPGTGWTIGRYEIRELLGSGGMSLVYAAHDPHLGRTVALKVLRPDRAIGGGDERLVAEARALARLSHPNVVQVHDAGIANGDGHAIVFLCMEHVAGRSLRVWLAEAPRPAREIVRIYEAAGRGVAAAHAAGIVHRDFKPDNVLIADDGRVLVGDFGLAHDRERARGAPAAAQGTPAYMAPEQRAGRPPDPRSDQFAFALALAEALSGTRPAAGDIAQRVDAVLAALRAPRRITAALRRGLALDPDDRFPELAALLDELAPRRRKRIALLAAAGIAIAATAATAAIAVALAPTATERADVDCDAGGDPIAAIWNPATRTAVRSAVETVRAQRERGGEAELVERRIDGFAADWRAMRDRVCHRLASVAPAARSTVEVERRCLDERLAHLRAFVELVAHATPALASRAVELSLQLRYPMPCWIDRDLDPAAAAHLASLRDELAALSLLRYADRSPATLARARRGLPEVRASGVPALIAEWLLVIGDLERSRDLGASSDALLEGMRAADRAARDDLRVRAMVGLTGVALTRNQLDEAERWTALADAVLERIPEDELLEAIVRNAQSMVAQGRHQPELALARASRALAIWTGAGHPNAGAAHNSLAAVLRAAGRADEALEHARAAVAIHERDLGAGHATTAQSLTNLGIHLHALGRNAEAAAPLARALEVFERLGERALVPEVLYVLAAVDSELGEAGAARRRFERCAALARESLGARHELTGACTALAGAALEREGALDDAAPLLDEALAILAGATTARGRSHRGRAALALARLTWQRGDRAAARDLAERAERDLSAREDQRYRDQLAAWRAARR